MKFRYNFKAKAKKTTKKKTTTKAVANVKTLIKKELHRQIENKTNQTLSSGNTITSYNNNVSLFVVNCCPAAAILQGTGQGDRIGNKIRTVSCYFNFVLRPTPFNGVSNPVPIPQNVIVMFGKVKNARAQLPTSGDFAKIWAAGNTFHFPYGNELDLLQDVNKDWFTVYKMLRFKVGNAANNGTGGNAAASYYSNNDYKYNVVRRINITKYMPKLYIFNEGTTFPTNDGLFMWAWCNPVDGSAASVIPCAMDYTLNYIYEDA